MSALLQASPRYRPMVAADLDAVMAIESVVYSHPWTRGNFSDSLISGYPCWVLEIAGAIAGYAVVSIAAGEAHLLNLSVAAAWQRRGYGREMLEFLVKFARDCGAVRMFLEVRPSNAAGLPLYSAAGFVEIGRRRGYYPDGGRPEDAIVMALDLA
jgi:[ribosomal protein S18]-alanine N-acetyltransferase